MLGAKPSLVSLAVVRLPGQYWSGLSAPKVTPQRRPLLCREIDRRIIATAGGNCIFVGMRRLGILIVALAVGLGGLALTQAAANPAQPAMDAMSDCECPPSNSPCPDTDKDKCGGMAGCVMRCAIAPVHMPAPTGDRAKALCVVAWTIPQGSVLHARALLPPLPPPRSSLSI